MTTTTLDLATTRRLLAEILEEFGEDYILPSSLNGQGCKYLEYDEHNEPTRPSCLIGQLLVKAGVSMDVLAPHEGEDPLCGWFSQFFSEESEGVTRLAIALTQAQTIQDCGNTWGEAVARFEEEVSS